MSGRGAQELSITVQHTQESLCLAHIYAVAGMAGVDHALRDIHDYGVDGQFDPVIIRGNRRIVSGHPLAFQAKATINWDLVDGNIVYDLEAKTYDDMVSRTESEVTMLLVLLCLPKNQAEWHTATPSATTIRNCCYWDILRGAPCGNVSSKRIFIPATNLLTPDSLKELLAAEKLRRETQWQ
jgi:hypothetical protein